MLWQSRKFIPVSLEYFELLLGQLFWLLLPNTTTLRTVSSRWAGVSFILFNHPILWAPMGRYLTHPIQLFNTVSSRGPVSHSFYSTIEYWEILMVWLLCLFIHHTLSTVSSRWAGNSLTLLANWLLWTPYGPASPVECYIEFRLLWESLWSLH